MVTKAKSNARRRNSGTFIDAHYVLNHLAARRTRGQLLRCALNARKASHGFVEGESGAGRDFMDTEVGS